MNKRIALATAGAFLRLPTSDITPIGELISASAITDVYPDVFDYDKQPNRAERRAMKKRAANDCK
jgi:hypothetical protein